MATPSLSYVPILKGMTNDLKAIAFLSPRARSHAKPLVELTHVSEYPSVDTALEAFVRRLSVAAIGQPVFVDLYGLPPGSRLATGENATIGGFIRIQRSGLRVTPTYGLGIDPTVWPNLRHVVSKFDRGFCFRIDLDDMDDQAEDSWAEVVERAGEMGLVPNEIDILMDLRSLDDRDLRDTENVILDFLLVRPRSFLPRSVIVAGSSALKHVGPVAKDGELAVVRRELELWARLRSELAGTLGLLFGDYGVVHPTFTVIGPNRNANGKIRYTRGNAIHYFRGSALRDPPKYQQYHGLAARVAGSPVYLGPDTSAGDRYINRCAQRLAGTGNLGTWVFVDQNHHFEYSALQVARLSTELASLDSAAAAQRLVAHMS